MSELPTGWTRVNFDGAVDVISDRGFRIKQKDYLPSGKLPVVDQGEGLIGGYTDECDAQVKSPPPVIVFGDHTRRFKFVKFPFAVGADGVKLLSPTPIWNTAFLFLQLGTIDLENRGYGRHYQHLRKKSLALAPFAEQTRIVAKLDELLSDLDAGVAELKAAQKKLAQYRQSLLKAAVEGALTAEWRSKNKPAETGVQLLERILTERRARWKEKQLAKFKEQGKIPPKDWQKKYPEPVKPDTTDLPELPQGWVWATIDQIAQVGTGVTPLRSKIAYFNDGMVPWVTSGALNSETVTSATELVTELALKECRLDIYPAGSLLVAMYGEGKTRGKCSELLIPATINQAIAAIVLEPEAQPSKAYLKAFLLDSYEKMRAQASGGVQPNLNLQIIKSITLPLPPYVEQSEITQLLDGQFDQINQQQIAVELALKQSAAQRQNILRAAFSGQLVPQDPNDEPASVLLERIRAERTARGAVKILRGRKF
ncbi:MAG: restriction endonuclease subunit S [Candidatus Contendobacter sp.]|nr:restriction endonuclease subunit S [Candidatus Contendobacter sp.]